MPEAGSHIVEGVWRVCRECGHVGRVMSCSVMPGIVCARCARPGTLLVYSESKPDLPKSKCPNCGKLWVDFGASLKNHYSACVAFSQMAKAYHAENSNLTLGDIFGGNDD